MAHSKSLLGSAVALTFALACAPASHPSDAAPPAPPAPHEAHQRKWIAPGTPPPPAPSVQGNLVYYGGHVISNVKVYAIFWGNSIASTTTQGVGGFFSAVTNSPYMDWLNEYNTNITASGGQQGTNQFIGRGTFAGSFTITPSAATTGTVDDSAIQTELTNQISAGNLPMPDGDSLYVTYFPPGLSITQGGSGDCVSGGFCAYHSTIAASGSVPEFYYAVMPDDGAGSGCATGCGTGTAFQNLSVSASHEMTEAITDAEVGVAGASNGPPLGWYDSTNGEIGDICAAATGDSATIGNYTVQLEWSNTANKCVSGQTASSDFSVGFTSTTAQVAQGGTAQLTVQVQSTAGSPGSVALSVTNLPSGVTATVSPASVSPGGTATVTLSATSAAAGVTNASVVIVGMAGSVTHTAAALVTVTQPPPSDFGLTASPQQGSLSLGGTLQVSIGTTVVNGAPGSIALSTTGMPSGVTASFQSNSVSAGSGTTMTLSASSSAALGTNTLAIVGQSAATSHQATYAVTVTSQPALTVTFTSPAQGSPVSGTVNVTLTATNASAQAQIAVALDGTSFGSGTGTSFTKSWDTTQATNGQHTLTATVNDTNGSQGSASATVTVNNLVSVKITTPQQGATLSGESSIEATATPGPGATLQRIDVYVDSLLAGSSSSSPANISLDTTRLPDGAHALSAVAFDSQGNQGTSATVNVTFQNGTPDMGGNDGGTGTGNPATGCGCGSGGASSTFGLAFAAVVLLALSARRRAVATR